MRPERPPLSLEDTVRNALAALGPGVAEKEVRLRVALAPGRYPVAGDAEPLFQVVLELLVHALELSSPGGLLEVTLAELGGSAQLTLEDAEVVVHASPGTFALTRELVELYGGTLQEDAAGDGKARRWQLRLPLLDVPAAAVNGMGSFESAPAVASPRAAPASVPLPSLSGVRVLLVEDTEDTRDVLSVLLEGADAQVRTASTVDEAWAQLKVERPDVLVSDLVLPGRDGTTLIGWIRALPASEGGTLPAVALTGYADVEDRTRALAAGFTSFLSKPVNAEELLGTVAKLSGRG